MGKFFSVIKQAASGWMDDNASLYAAALSFYTFFSMAPLLLITVAIAGFFFGREAVNGQIVHQISGLVGKAGAGVIQSMLISTYTQPTKGIVGIVIGVITLLLGASAVFLQLQSALNIIWKVDQSKLGGLGNTIKKRLLSFGLVFSMGFLLLVSLVISAVISAVGSYFDRFFPGAMVLSLINMLVSLLVIAAFFALIFKYLPDISIDWGDVWPGAIVTSVFFTIGKSLIGLYLGSSSISSTYGAAASIVVILLWIYYASQILFFGAEFTRFYSIVYRGRDTK